MHKPGPLILEDALNLYLQRAILHVHRFVNEACVQCGTPVS